MEESLIDQIARELKQACGARPESTDKGDLRYRVSVPGQPDFVTEVRDVTNQDSTCPCIEVWYTGDRSEPFERVAQFTTVVDAQAIASFVQTFAML